jgi:hypothetical protein
LSKRSLSYPVGRFNAISVANDWTGTGEARIGVFNPKTAAWQLKINGNGVFDGCGVDACLSFGPTRRSPEIRAMDASPKTGAMEEAASQIAQRRIP